MSSTRSETTSSTSPSLRRWVRQTDPERDGQRQAAQGLLPCWGIRETEPFGGPDHGTRGVLNDGKHTNQTRQMQSNMPITNGLMIAVVAALMTGGAPAQTTMLISPGTGAGDDIKNGGFESGSTAPSAIPAPCQPRPKPSFAPKSARLRKKQREENRQPRMTRINTNGFQTKPPRHSRHGIRVHLCPFVVREYRNGRS